MRAQGGMERFVQNGWAGKDFTHINYEGGRRIARALVDALNDFTARHASQRKAEELRIELGKGILTPQQRRRIERWLLAKPRLETLKEPPQMTMPTVEALPEKLLALLSYDASSPLIFSSGLFLFLFAGFLLLYGTFRRAPMARIVYVILFSLYFYYKSSGIYFLLLIFAATSDFLIARVMARTESRAGRRWLVALSVAVNLGMLGYFKYTNFLIEIANQMFGQGFLQFRNIFLPVGISFFVFQSMSYTIDVYRRQLQPLTNWFDYLFYLSFFRSSSPDPSSAPATSSRRSGRIPSS